VERRQTSFGTDAAAYGNGLYAFMNYQNIITTTSIESSDWDSIKIANEPLAGLTYDDVHGFVAISSYYTYTSKDGKHWKSSTLSNCELQNDGGPLISYKGILLITEQFGTGSLYNDYCYSTDAVNWTYVPNTDSYLGISSTELGFVKWGAGTYINISTDGINWKSYDPFTGYDEVIRITTTSTGNATIACLYGPTTFFSYNSKSNSWNYLTTVTEYALQTLSAVTEQFLLSIIMVDDDDEILESSDGGHTWNSFAVGLFDSVFVPFALNGYAVQVSENYVNYSTDGKTWKSHSF